MGGDEREDGKERGGEGQREREGRREQIVTQQKRTVYGFIACAVQYHQQESEHSSGRK